MIFHSAGKKASYFLHKKRGERLGDPGEGVARGSVFDLERKKLKLPCGENKGREKEKRKKRKTFADLK